MRFEYTDGRMPAAMLKEGVTYYLAYEQIGSLRAVADGAGNVVKRIDYDAFGNIVEDSSPLFEIPFGFAGGLHDRDTGLVRFGYRDYDPGVGRWAVKDPVGFGKPTMVSFRRVKVSGGRRSTPPGTSHKQPTIIPELRSRCCRPPGRPVP